MISFNTWGMVRIVNLAIIPGILSGPADFLGCSVFPKSSKSDKLIGLKLKFGILTNFSFSLEKYSFCLFLSIVILSLRVFPTWVKNLLKIVAISFSLFVILCLC